MSDPTVSALPAAGGSPTWPGGARPADAATAAPETPANRQPDPPATTGDTLPVDCVATRGPLFGMALRFGALTVATLGIYRFWMKTRLRRWYWSSVRPGGAPLEYVGEPLEKLLGFLIAVVILAVYIGLVNLVLMFFSLSVFAAAAPAFLLSFLGVIPLLFYARYRARRYVLARTRWRGLRFGLDPGAWGYARRAIGHWLVTLLTLGVLWPRMTFALEKYRTDRTRFGDLRLEQGGEWRMLWPPFAQVLAPAALSAATVLVALEGAPRFYWLLAVTGPWLLCGLVHFTVSARRIMANHKSAGPLGLVARPRTGRILRIYLFGGLAALILVGLLGLAALSVASMILTGAGIELDSAGPGVAAAGIVGYILIALVWSTVRHVFITMPVWKHYAQTLTLTGTAALPEVTQRERDTFREAEGFAEALDLGAAI